MIIKLQTANELSPKITINHSIRSESRLQDDYFAHAKENCKWCHKHIKTLTVFLYKNEAEYKQRKGITDVVPMLVKGSKNGDQNRQKTARNPSCTRPHWFSAGTTLSVWHSAQVAFTGPALKCRTSSLGLRWSRNENCFWVLSYGLQLKSQFWPNQS